MGRNERAFAIPMLCGIIGIVLAIMLQLFNEWEILVDEFITSTIVLREIQIVIIVMWFAVGIVLSASQ